MTATVDREHRCPGGCGATVKFERVACYPCWWRLPAPLRLTVQKTYNNRDVVPSAWHQAVNDAIDWYKDNPAEVKP